MNKSHYRIFFGTSYVVTFRPNKAEAIRHATEFWRAYRHQSPSVTRAVRLYHNGVERNLKI